MTHAPAADDVPVGEALAVGQLRLADPDRSWYEAQVNRVFADEAVLLERLIDDAVTATRAPVVDVSGVRFADVSTAHLIVNAALSSTAGQLRLVPSGPTW